MQERKYCQKCCKLISDINTSDYYSHIRIKYCKSCAEQINREHAADLQKQEGEKLRKTTDLQES